MYVLLVANVIFYLAAGFDQFLVLLLATAVSYVVAVSYTHLDCKYRSALLSEGRERDAAVTQNICKNPAGIFQYHRAYVLCSFQTLEYLQL